MLGEPEDKKKSTAIVLYLIFLFLVMSLIYRAIILFYLPNETSQPVEQAEVVDPDKYFEGCDLKFENCSDADTNCNLHLFCNDQKYETCRIYDCGDYYGVAKRVAGAEMVFVEETKPDAARVLEKKTECKGTLEILENDCVNGKTEILSSVVTNGECKVNNFMVYFKEVGLRPIEFSSVENEQYLITANYCGDLDKVVAVGRGGVSIDRKRF